MKHTQLVISWMTISLLLLGSGIGFAQTPGETKPNIVFIMVDDGRYDEYRPTGAPSWFEAPAIERIVNEGVNFTRAYAPTAMCGPSRASVYTGLYAHQHGVENNNYGFADSLATISQILKDQGYYTGFFGKFGQGFGQPHDFDYFVNATNDDYCLTDYNVNGTEVFHIQNSTEVFSFYLDMFFDSISAHSDQPFAIFFFPFAPHPPSIPMEIYETIYDSLDVNFPVATEPYPSLYPEYYYEATSNWTKDSLETVDFLRDRFACLKGVDDVVADIFYYMDSVGVADSAFVMYTSDNGYIAGEHDMRAKVFAIEESIHVPLFVKYAPWFGDSIIIDNELIELIDIPSTFVDLLGLEDTFGFEGYSLQLLAEPDTVRRFVRYEYGGDDDPDDTGFDVPDVRGIRSFDHLYTKAECNCFAEEFYDFSTDPLQQVNQILNLDYQQLINSYRTILDSMLLAVDDTILLDIRNCGLVGAFEIEDSLDQDCNGLVDDNIGPKNWFQDMDADLYGNIDSLVISVFPVAGYVLDSSDCDDTNAFINPIAIDYCDSIDNNCNGILDEFVLIPVVSPADSIFFCNGGNETLTASPEISGFSVNWFLNGAPIAGADSYTYNANSTGNYTAKFTSPAECVTESAVVPVTEFVVTKPKVKNSSLSNDLTINNPVKLSVKKIIGQTYQWYYNDVIIWGAVSHKFSAGLPGNHKCQVVDLNGCVSTSKNYLVIQTLKEASEEIPYMGEAEILLFPNPAKDNFTLEFTSATEYFGEGRIKIMNMLGAEIFAQVTTVMSGSVYENITLSNTIPAGIYIVELQIGEQRWKEQLVVQ